ncbi:MAG TPA: helix-turn-helix domain-containing protein [Thermoanaerobaculia bacterium]|jgi:AcrR family transcriptional regulator
MGRTPRVSRKDVLDAARETFVEQGYEGARLTDIAARIGVSPAALLRHAPTKLDLFRACMGSGEPDLLPLAFLKEMDGAEDPRKVLRRVAETMVPFLEAKLRDIVARWVYFKKIPGLGRVPLPFDPEVLPTPPQRNLRLLEDYVRRAVRKGRLRAADPRAAAFAFLSTVHSFVFLQHVVQVFEKPMPLAEYLDAVLEIWERGAMTPAPRRRNR